jgi:HEPN domain-containing protein
MSVQDPMTQQLILNEFARRVFRSQADFDYVSARSNFRLQLRQQFLWSALQCIEKYLKAILLYNGKSARFPTDGRKPLGHNLKKLLAEVNQIELFALDLKGEDIRFIEYLSDQGNNRYISTEAYSTRSALSDLDGLVWRLRRYCRHFSGRVLGVKEPMPGLLQAQIKGITDPAVAETPHKFRLHAGELEKILKRPASDPARKALVWGNLYYGAKKRFSVRYRAFGSSESPPSRDCWPEFDWKVIEEFIQL